MNLLKTIFVIGLCSLSACHESAPPHAVEKPDDAQGTSVAAPNPAMDPEQTPLVGQSSQCPAGSMPFNLAPWLGADITIACGLRSERKYVTQSGAARIQFTYEYTTNTPQEELAVLNDALETAGFVETTSADPQPTQLAYFKKGYDSVNIWANPERKPDFKDPQANGAIGIDMPDIANATPTAAAN